MWIEGGSYNPCDVLVMEAGKEYSELFKKGSVLSRLLVPESNYVASIGRQLIAFVVSVLAVESPEECTMSEVHSWVRDGELLLAACRLIAVGEFDFENGGNKNWGVLKDVAKEICYEASHEPKCFEQGLTTAAAATARFAEGSRLARFSCRSTCSFERSEDWYACRKAVESIEPGVVEVFEWAATGELWERGRYLYSEEGATIAGGEGSTAGEKRKGGDVDWAARIALTVLMLGGLCNIGWRLVDWWF